MELFADGISLGKDNGRWRTATDFVIPGNTKVIAVAATKLGFPPPGILGSSSNGLVTNSSWKCSEQVNLGWNSPDFDDRNWSPALEMKRHGDGPTDGPGGYITGIDPSAKWIWAIKRVPSCYCRLNLQ